MKAQIPLPTAVLMTVNIIVGVGVYFLLPKMAQMAGSASPWGWVAAGVLTLPIVATLAQAARHLPAEGGFSSYAGQLGPRAGFLAQWSFVLAYASITSLQIPFAAELLMGFFEVEASKAPLWAVGLAAAVSLLNMGSLTLLSRIQGGVTLLKLSPLVLAIVAALFFKGQPAAGAIALPSQDVGSTLPMALFGYLGFESATSLSRALSGGPRRVGPVMLTGFVLAALLYILFHMSVLHVMGVDALVAEGFQSFPNHLGLEVDTAAYLSRVLKIVLLIALSNSIAGTFLAAHNGLLELIPTSWISVRAENPFGRAWKLVLAHGALLAAVCALGLSSAFLGATANLGLLLPIGLTCWVVIKKVSLQRGAKAVSYLSLVGIALLGWFSALDLGSTLSQRLVLFASVAAVMGVGFWLGGKTQPRAATAHSPKP